MRLSKLFTKTLHSAPADEQALNAQLLIRAGYIYKEMAGVYAYLPLGLKVQENIKRIVREEMNAIGGQELIMTNLQRSDLWQITDRWDETKVDVWFKTKLQNGSELGLAWSHEEPITDMMRNYISSYRDLPINVYQFQTKLRNEVRAKSGIMRGREFVMKDLYSYSLDEKQHQAFYDSVIEAYLRIFERIGIGDKTFLTYASGGAFTKFSHEFQTLTPAGEDVIYLNREKRLAINQEVYNDEVIKHLKLNRADMEQLKASEVGNIFSFGTVKSEQLDLSYTSKSGDKQYVVIGSYGIGITRLIGVITELFADQKGLVWPEAIAPYKVHLIRIGHSDELTKKADKLYKLLTDSKIEVIYDDRDLRVGEMLKDADLLGIPHRVVVSDKGLANNTLEWKKRTDSEAKIINEAELVSILES